MAGGTRHVHLNPHGPPRPHVWLFQVACPADQRPRLTAMTVGGCSPRLGPVSTFLRRPLVRLLPSSPFLRCSAGQVQKPAADVRLSVGCQNRFWDQLWPRRDDHGPRHQPEPLLKGQARPSRRGCWTGPRDRQCLLMPRRLGSPWKRSVLGP